MATNATSTTSSSKVSKSGSTRVITAQLLAVVAATGLEIKKAKGWIHVFAPNKFDRRMLIHTTGKSDAELSTNCIELVGFKSPVENLTVAHPNPPTKGMPEMIDCNQDAKAIVKAFYMLAKHLIATPNAAPLTSSRRVAQSTPAEAVDLNEILDPKEVKDHKDELDILNEEVQARVA